MEIYAFEELVKSARNNIASMVQDGDIWISNVGRTKLKAILKTYLDMCYSDFEVQTLAENLRDEFSTNLLALTGKGV